MVADRNDVCMTDSNFIVKLDIAVLQSVCMLSPNFSLSTLIQIVHSKCNVELCRKDNKILIIA